MNRPLFVEVDAGITVNVAYIVDIIDNEEGGTQIDMVDEYFVCVETPYSLVLDMIRRACEG